MPELTISVIKIFSLGALSFILAFLITPFLTGFLYKHKLWRKDARDKSIDGKDMPFFQKFHGKDETRVPRFGGLLIWVTTIILAFLFLLLSRLDVWWLKKLNFLSRSQTWLPIFALASASLVGLADDVLQVFAGSKNFLWRFWEKNGKYIGGGIKLKYRLIMVVAIGLVGAWWFYSKLGYATLHIPGNGDILIGLWYIPLFILVMLAVYSGGVIDGLDGLAGGTFASIFAAFAGIALFQQQIDLAAFCIVIVGALLSFLWFNIPPARFYMGETGMLGLCCALTVVAFLTDSVLVLPIIAFLPALEAGSVIIQLISKKFRGKKIFLAAPIHHHFEAKGWPAYKITMRFWVVGIVMAIIGVAIRLLG
ncbi:MAG: hypothetical protein A3F95_00440 [Candidatus Nealsonbacteria bacterium RIFCSPLOWO2_12_FULL_39_31]|uniref:Phospho-N-acetylmuramoyl-pentapeptide-transferase n=2 Tax=Candidatus Nealsoniibacteriota TaxID=1817911 RepID=A0A1G2EKU9_9BACT|nr:MAG: hypothetical protein A2626_01575 [Candidatus Nealsonbacteria bacterium RIFCSPHIGHO2_01_FULL_38_55]OGZ21793.1 MAG: hypothetical protein A3C48_01055 [Candidatus Nealsonbacteria bacterium RIFCSPHIGHO2_02_FULL_38_75]OGZ23428.1 MAG: hypothetical protein A2981_00155 [Candidatus Nealsonbacteria bacterium RIFCSPLOWO2_01_FULL_38_120]OGZ23560.1 MAG: hypothetical protein A3E18_01545 [Candidatus Nealsonbacteria bacterium RIFCSPHIGHO2_12_FULL_38_18]OGZ25889.1 MAG: hypothetical protein A3I85_00360 [C